jgi:hypothetical protein
MIFFWKMEPVDEIGENCLSQWFPSIFEVDGTTYDCAEQYMMAEKARIFGDEEIRKKIMNTKNDPHKCKHLGRKVKGFDKYKWSQVARDVVFKGNYAKFSQNHELKEYLLSTDNQLLVEASPYDKIWGIGLDSVNAEKTAPINWPGSNWLGQVLMKVRDTIRNEK